MTETIKKQRRKPGPVIDAPPKHPVTQHILENTTFHDEFLGDAGAYASLTPALRRAVDVFVMGGSQLQAARAAGYGNTLGSQRSAGHAIARKPEVIAAIAEREAMAQEEAGLSLTRSWIETRRIGYFDPKELFDKKGALIPVEKWSDDARAAVQSLEVNELFEGAGRDRVKVGHVVKVKFWDKIAALTMHLKARGILGTGPLDGAAVVINNNTQINNTDAAVDRVVNAANPTDASIEYEQLMRMVPAIEHKP